MSPQIQSCRPVPILPHQVHHDFHHHFHVLGAALGNHQRHGNERRISDALGTVGPVQNAVVQQKPQKERCRDAFVAVAERMVLRDKIKEHRRFLFHARVKFHTAEGLVNLPDATLERIVLLVGEQFAAAKLLLEPLNCRHRVLVSRVELFRIGRLTQHKTLVVIIVQRIQRKSVVRHHINK